MWGLFTPIRLIALGVRSCPEPLNSLNDSRSRASQSSIAESVRFDPRAVAKSLLHTLGLQGVADVRADAMPTGMARLVELGRALATKPRILLLDEPSSGLGDEESDAFADLLLKLTAEGLGILLVEHDVGLVMRVCSRIFVLDFGRPIAEGTPEEIQAHPAVQAAYLGTPEAAEELPDAEAEEEGVPA